MLEHVIAVFDEVEGRAADFMLRKMPRPQPAADEVLIRVQAFALNQADLLLTEGRHYTRQNLPIRLGFEACGVVERVGSEVTRFTVGDRVCCIPNVDGPYSTGGEYALAHESFLARWPDNYSAAQATSVWGQYLTAYFPFVELFPIQRGDWVMITAATGGTGLGSVRLAKLLGARVIATTRSEHKIATLQEHGADVVISTDNPDFPEQVMKATEGAGVRLIADSLGGPYVARLAQTLADRGVLYVYGMLGGKDDLTLPALTLVHRGAGLYGYSLINELRQPEKLERARNQIERWLASGELQPPLIDQEFALTDVRAAYERMRTGKQTGKIVVHVP